MKRITHSVTVMAGIMRSDLGMLKDVCFSSLGFHLNVWSFSFEVWVISLILNRILFKVVKSLEGPNERSLFHEQFLIYRLDFHLASSISC